MHLHIHDTEGHLMWLAAFNYCKQRLPKGKTLTISSSVYPDYFKDTPGGIEVSTSDLEQNVDKLSLECGAFLREKVYKQHALDMGEDIVKTNFGYHKIASYLVGKHLQEEVSSGYYIPLDATRFCEDGSYLYEKGVVRTYAERFIKGLGFEPQPVLFPQDKNEALKLFLSRKWSVIQPLSVDSPLSQLATVTYTNFDEMSVRPPVLCSVAATIKNTRAVKYIASHIMFSPSGNNLSLLEKIGRGWAIRQKHKHSFNNYMRISAQERTQADNNIRNEREPEHTK